MHEQDRAGTTAGRVAGFEFAGGDAGLVCDSRLGGHGAMVAPAHQVATHPSIFGTGGLAGEFHQAVAGYARLFGFDGTRLDHHDVDAEGVKFHPQAVA